MKWRAHGAVLWLASKEIGMASSPGLSMELLVALLTLAAPLEQVKLGTSKRRWTSCAEVLVDMV